MLVLPQKTLTKWNAKNKKYYESIVNDKGEQKYLWTKPGDEFEVDIEDLPKYSRSIIVTLCDYCLEKGVKTVVEREYVSYVVSQTKNIKKDACQNCLPLKIRENYG